MESVKSKISYLRGLTEGMKVESDEGKILVNLCDILKQMDDKIEKVIKQQKELEEYVTSIDEDLGDIEEEFYNFYTEEYDDFEYNDDDFQEYTCSQCNEAVYIDKSLIGNEESISCPNCKYDIKLKITDSE